MSKTIIKKISKIFITVMISVLILSFSIAFTILFRPFYYAHIQLLNIPGKTNYSYQEIKEAYDDVIDYTTLNKTFKTGRLKYSQSGYNHFKDCKNLFKIDFILLGISATILIIKKKYFNNLKLKKHSLEFWSSVLIIIFIISLLITVFILGFDKCFEIFHSIFFLGKTNWLFDSDTDEIINILPQQYFLDCTLLIILIITVITSYIIIKEKDLIPKNKKKVL